MLILRLQTPDDNEFACTLLAENAYESEWSLASWEKIKPLVKGQTVVVLIPASDVLLTQTELATRNARQLKQALPFALEEQIVGGLDEQHYVWTAEKGASTLHVAIIEKARLQQWQDVLQQQGVHANYILPDVFALPWHDDSLAVWQQGGQTWVRNGQYAGFSCPDEAFPMVAETLGMTDADQRLHFYSDSAVHTKLNINQVESDPDILLRDALKSAFDLNLLKNFQSEAQSALNDGWRRWRLAAGIALFAALLAFGIKAMEVRDLQQQLAAAEQRNVATFSELFPKVQNVDPRGVRSRAQSELTSLRQSQGNTQKTRSALPNLAVLAKAFNAHKKLSISDIQVRKDKMTINFESPDLQAIDALEQQLSEATGTRINIRSTRTANTVRAQLVLPMSGGAS